MPFSKRFNVEVFLKKFKILENFQDFGLWKMVDFFHWRPGHETYLMTFSAFFRQTIHGRFSEKNGRRASGALK